MLTFFPMQRLHFLAANFLPHATLAFPGCIWSRVLTQRARLVGDQIRVAVLVETRAKSIAFDLIDVDRELTDSVGHVCDLRRNHASGATVATNPAEVQVGPPRASP